MSEITIGDVTGTAKIQVDGSSLAGKSDLSSLYSDTAKFVADLPHGIDDVDFQSATLTANFQSPSISIDDKRSLTIKSGVNAVLTRYTSHDSPLLGSDPTVPSITIGGGDYWLSFELDGTLDISATEKIGSGFGVGVEGASAVKLYGYNLFNGTSPYPSFGDAVRQTVNSFGVVTSATDLRNQKTGTVRVSDVSGTVTVSGSYSFPIGVNQLALAEAIVPFKVSINPSLGLKVGGSVAVTGDYAVRSWRKSDTELILGLFKKRGTTLKATFSASAGLAANAGNTDLVQAFFSAISPKIDLQTVLLKTDPRYDAMNAVLKDSISHALNVSINASAAASFGDEAALVYSIDLTGDRPTTDKAINAAIGGDWTLLPGVGKELKNVIGTDRETKFTVAINLLGVFDYESIADFVQSSTIVRNDEDGSITVTDKATATRIAVASMPYLANPDKLRSALYESAMLTAAYAAAGGKLTPAIEIKQSLLIYHAKTNAAALRKDLRLAVAVGKLTESQLNSLAITNPKPRHVLIDASQDIKGAQAVNLFFADPSARTARDLETLKSVGRQVLAALLDASDPVDQRRIQVLNSPGIWAAMDNNHFPHDSPASYSDWYDVTFWANAIHDAAAPLRAALQALDRVPPGTDPSKDANFTKARKSLRKAIAEVTHDTHAAFEHGWPIAVIYQLAGAATAVSLTATWDSKLQVPISQQMPSRPNALAKRIAGRTDSDGQALAATT